jgi:hypothetical protein
MLRLKDENKWQKEETEWKLGVSKGKGEGKVDPVLN